MKKYVIIGIILLASVSIGTLGYLLYKKPVQSASVAQKAINCTFSESGLVGRINEVRTNKVTLDNKLDAITQTRVGPLTVMDNHAGFNKLAAESSFGPEYLYLGEVLASSPCPSDTQIFSQWRNSPTHWAVITNERYDVVGIGLNSQNIVSVIFGDLR